MVFNYLFELIIFANKFFNFYNISYYWFIEYCLLSNALKSNEFFGVFKPLLIQANIDFNREQSPNKLQTSK